MARAQILKTPANATPVAAEPVRPIRIPKTADLVAAHIRGQIVRGELREGDLLMPEAHLVRQFATSRPTLREAVRILENEGLISITRGSRTGARVHRPSVDNVARHAGFALQAAGATLGDIYQARLAIEPFAAGLAARRATAGMVTRLRREFEELRELLDAQNMIEYRIRIARFHQSIVEGSGNKTLTLTTRMLRGIIEKHQSQFQESRSVVAKLKGPARAKFYQTGMKSLVKIIDLIESKDSDGAEAHWRKHIEEGNEVWLSGYDRGAVIDALD